MKFKKLVASALLASMALSMVACGDSSSGTGGATQVQGGGQEITEDNPYGLKGDGAYSCSDEPLTLTAFVHWVDLRVLTDDMPIPTEMARYTNVTFDGVAAEYSSSSDQEFNLLMTDTVLPDLVGGKLIDLATYGQEGAFIPLNDLIDEYAPNIKAVFEMYPEAEAAVTDEFGDIYAVPFVYEAVVAQVWFIRQDWLDVLGLEIPTNFEEFENVLYAFRNDDPNQNGEKDEVPFFQRYTSSNVSTASILQIFGISDFFHVANDGQVKMGLYTEEYKDAMLHLGQWYADGVIDQEIFTRDQSARDVLFASNNGGVLFDWIASTSAYNNTMVDYVEDFHIVGMAPPADVNGDQWVAYSRQRTDGYGWSISVDNEHVIESIKVMDFLFTDAGRTVTTYGIEGETFNYNEAGEPIFTDEVLYGERSLTEYINDNGGMLKPMAYLHVAEYEYQVMHEEGAKINDIYLSEGYSTAMNRAVPALSFTVEEANTISSLYPTCRSYMEEKNQVWTQNVGRVEGEFDEYMKTLKDMGMDQVLEIYQNAYDRLMASVN